MTAISLGFEFAQAGFLRFHAKIEGESTGVVARHWFSLTDQGLLVHAEKPALVRYSSILPLFTLSHQISPL